MRPFVIWSQYGFCDRLSQAIARGIGKADAQVQLVDLRATDPQELAALIGEAHAVVVPTWPAQPDADLQTAIGTLLASLQARQWVACYERLRWQRRADRHPCQPTAQPRPERSV
jgi:flavorubredoxin